VASQVSTADEMTWSNVLHKIYTQIIHDAVVLTSTELLSSTKFAGTAESQHLISTVHTLWIKKGTSILLAITLANI